MYLPARIGREETTGLSPSGTTQYQSAHRVHRSLKRTFWGTIEAVEFDVRHLGARRMAIATTNKAVVKAETRRLTG
jgi:hypothetical protein